MFNKKNRGVSLIELMLSLTLSILVLGILMQVYLATEKNHLVLRAWMILQENTDTAIELLTSEIHSADGIKDIFDNSLSIYKSNVIKNYFIEKTQRKDETGKFIYALYLKEDKKPKVELVEGVTKMKVYYSKIEQGKLVEYEAYRINRPDQVIGISIELEIESLDYFSLKKREYLYAAVHQI